MNNREEIINAAHKYALKGQIDDAIKEYLKLLSPSIDGNIHNSIGDLYLKKGVNEEAIKHYRYAADMFKKEDSHSKAIALFHKILSIDPDQHTVVIELADLNAERGFFKQAVEGLVKAAESYKSKGLPMKAINIYKKALQVVPSDMDLTIRVADLQLESNHINSARKMYLAIAKEYERNGESVHAEKMYKKVITLDPDNIESFIHLSRLAENDHDLELAFEYISKAAALAPNNNDVMLEYSSLAAKTNRDISENPIHDQEAIKIPDSMNGYKNIDNSHTPLKLSSENSFRESSQVIKPVSDSPPLMNVESSGTGFAEINRTESVEYHEVPIKKNEIHDEGLYEDQSKPDLYNSINGKALKAVKQQGPAEGEYDNEPEQCETDTARNEPVIQKSEKDVRRLKKRVKTSWIHILIILFFIFVTAISFIITFNFIKDSQSVDVETTEHVIASETYSLNEEKESVSHEKQNNTDQLTTDENQPANKPAVTAGEHSEVINQEELTLPGKETEPDTESSIMENKTIDKLAEQEPSSNTDYPEVETEPTLKSEMKTVNKKDPRSIDSESMTENITEAAPEQENIHAPENTEVDTQSLLQPDTETVGKTEDVLTAKRSASGPELSDVTQQSEDINSKEAPIIIFRELFNNNANNWDTAETSAAHVRIEGGHYYIRNIQETGAHITLNGPELSTDQNFEIEVFIKSIDPPVNYSYGLVFGAKDNEDFFVFQIISEKNYSISKHYRGVTLELAADSLNDTLLYRDQFNIISVKQKENRLSFYINETFIDEIADISITGRKTGFFIGSNTEIAVDKFLVYKQP